MSKKRDKHTAIILSSIVIFMIVLAFASAPLYRIFCEQTGFAGTPKINKSGQTQPTDKKIKVQFIANVHRDLPWKFKPLQSEITVKIGETSLAFYEAENLSDSEIIGMATYNVSPDNAAPYFNKIACFCFEQQLLHPHQKMEMPVQFFIDPEILKDPNLKDLQMITLSYTFFVLSK